MIRGTIEGYTFLSTTDETICKILNDRMGTIMEKEEKVSEGQAGFRSNRSRVDHLYTLGKRISLKIGRTRGYERTVSFQMYRRPMTHYGEMGCRKVVGNLGAEERCGE